MKMKKNLQIFFALVFSFAVIFSLTACGGDKPADDQKGDTKPTENSRTIAMPTDKIIRTNNSSEPGALDPGLAQGTHDSWVLNHTFEGLMKNSKDGKAVPGAAEKMEVSEDGLKYVFTLRKDAKWSNGDPVTAHDFEFAWKRALNPEFASDYAFQLYYIKGGEAYNTVQKPGIYYVKDKDGNDTKEVDHEVKYTEADLAGLDVAGKSDEEVAQMVYEKWLAEKRDEVQVKATDDYTLEVELEKPTPYFDQITAFYTLYPVNKKVVEENPDWAKNAETHVSNGPFKLTKWNHNAKIEIRKNEHYYNKDAIKIEGVDFDIIESEDTTWQKYAGGEYDILLPLPQSVVPMLREEGTEELQIGGEVGIYYYNLNGTQKGFDNVNIRKGLSYALDRKTICDKIAQGGQIPAFGLIPPGLIDDQGKDFRGEQGELFEFNVEKANEYFEKGLEETGLTKEDFNGKVILYNTQEGHKKIAQVVQSMWKENLGIEFALENTEFQTKLDREKARDYDVSRAGWVGDYADPMTILDLWVTGGSFNDSAYSNPKYDELIEKAKSSADNKVRMDAMKEAEKLIVDEMPVIPIYYYTQPYAVKPYLKGVYKGIINYPSMIEAEFQE